MPPRSPGSGSEQAAPVADAGRHPATSWSASMATACRRWHGGGSRGGSADRQRLGGAGPPSVTLPHQRRRGTQARGEARSWKLGCPPMVRPYHIRRTEHHGHPTHPTITNQTSPHFAEALGPPQRPGRARPSISGVSVPVELADSDPVDSGPPAPTTMLLEWVTNRCLRASVPPRRRRARRDPAQHHPGQAATDAVAPTPAPPSPSRRRTGQPPRGCAAYPEWRPSAR